MRSPWRSEDVLRRPKLDPQRRYGDREPSAGSCHSEAGRQRRRETAIPCCFHRENVRRVQEQKNSRMVQDRLNIVIGVGVLFQRPWVILPEAAPRFPDPLISAVQFSLEYSPLQLQLSILRLHRVPLRQFRCFTGQQLAFPLRPVIRMVTMSGTANSS
ncbi:uncharacterized protein BDV17DRAFT_150407 [Aspergillus undulatus]|uniref:uncharacterized protein n=1 Tax=Aspergillus undulatus TaxID=1810928 RepID=UPI003CCDB1CD